MASMRGFWPLLVKIVVMAVSLRQKLRNQRGEEYQAGNCRDKPGPPGERCYKDLYQITADCGDDGEEADDEKYRQGYPQRASYGHFMPFVEDETTRSLAIL